MKQILTSNNAMQAERERIKETVKVKLPEIIRKMMHEAQNASELLIADKQLVAATGVIKNSTDAVVKKLEKKIGKEHVHLDQKDLQICDPLVDHRSVDPFDPSEHVENDELVITLFFFWSTSLGSVYRYQDPQINIIL